MAAGDTGVSICSDALLLIGAKAISSFNDGTDESSVCDRLYPDIRDSVLVTYPWSFGMKKVQLAQLITTPNSVWRYEYQLPGDKLANPRAVYNSANPGSPVQKDWEIQGDKLLTNLTSVFIDYQFSVPSTLCPNTLCSCLNTWWLGTLLRPSQNSRTNLPSGSAWPLVTSLKMAVVGTCVPLCRLMARITRSELLKITALSQ